MVKITIDKERCKGCGLCVEACPLKIIKLTSKLNKSGMHYAIVDGSKCTGCGSCFLMCPDLCIEIEK